MALASTSLDRLTPVFCSCSRRPGFVRSQVTGFWVCVNCRHPTQAWWEGHKKDMDRLADAGLCTADAGVLGSKPRKCAKLT